MTDKVTPTQADRRFAMSVAALAGWPETIMRDMLNGTCEAIPHEYAKEVAIIQAFASHASQARAEGLAEGKLIGARLMQDVCLDHASFMVLEDTERFIAASEIRALSPADVVKGGGVMTQPTAELLQAINMDHDPDADLIQRVVQAMREAARTNGSDSPHTELEAMALAAIRTIKERR